MKVIRLFSKISATSAPYNQFSLGFKSVQSINIPYFNDDVKVYWFYYLLYVVKVTKSLSRNPDACIIHTHNIFLAPITVLFKYLFNKKIVFTLHTSYHLLGARNKLLSILLFYFFDSVVCCSNSVFNSLPPFISKNNVIVIVNGIRSDLIQQHYSPNKKVYNSTINYKLVQACRLVKGKNINSTIDFVLNSSNSGNYKLHLDIYGDGPLLKNLKNKYNLNFISFLGAIPRHELYSKIRSSDIFISLSKGEGMPVAVLESIALGIPTILSDIPPHREVYELFPQSVFIVETYDDFINSIEEIRTKTFSMDLKIIDSLSIDKMQQKYISIYEK